MKKAMILNATFLLKSYVFLFFFGESCLHCVNKIFIVGFVL